jgi:UDP-N-acetyl-D-mannosaminuronic acid dehydrogenase
MKKKICVVGLGYIGLPTAALLANNGYAVIGVDINPQIVNKINQGQIHIIEPDLDIYVHSAVKAGFLSASTSPEEADIYIICVPTPIHDHLDTPQPNVDYVMEAALSISSFVKPGSIVILESTSPVGTTHRMAEVLGSAGVELSSVYVAYCPERVLPGKIISELIENDRVVGGLSPVATKIVSDFYRTFVKGEVLTTDAKTAEMCKLTENSFRDVNIAFANELSLICSKEGVNVWKLIELANHHPRVNILRPGIGVGGHCIAVDPWFIVARDSDNARIIRMAREINDSKTDWVINQIKFAAMNFAKRNGRTARIACLGLAFKPNTDDLRESPAVHIVQALTSQGFDVSVVEPNIPKDSRFIFVTLEEAMECADVIAVLVKHDGFIYAEKQHQFARSEVLDFCGLLET